jgi:hypothetical protein
MDEGFAGTKLYRQRVCFFLPFSLSTLDLHKQCKFVLKVDDKNICFVCFFCDQHVLPSFTPYLNLIFFLI